MLAGKMVNKPSPPFSPEKTSELLVYAKQMAMAFVDFSCSKPKHYKDTYALNVLEIIDRCASEDRESPESSMTSNFVAKSTVT